MLDLVAKAVADSKRDQLFQFIGECVVAGFVIEAGSIVISHMLGTNNALPEKSNKKKKSKKKKNKNKNKKNGSSKKQKRVIDLKEVAPKEEVIESEPEVEASEKESAKTLVDAKGAPVSSSDKKEVTPKTS